MKTYSKPTRRKLHGKSSTHYYVRERDTVTGNRRWINTGKTSLEAATTYRRTLELNDATAGPTKRDRTLGAALEDWLELKATKMTPRGLRVYEGYREIFGGLFGGGSGAHKGDDRCTRVSDQCNKGIRRAGSAVVREPK